MFAYYFAHSKRCIAYRMITFCVSDVAANKAFQLLFDRLRRGWGTLRSDEIKLAVYFRFGSICVHGIPSVSEEKEKPLTIHRTARGYLATAISLGF